MKKIISKITACLLAAVFMFGAVFFVPDVSYKENITAFAAVPNEIETDDGLVFELNHDDQTAILRAYKGWKAEIVVPSAIDVPYTDDLSVPYTITRITFADEQMNYSFKATALEKITIPGTVEELNGTFSHSYWWSYLKEVVIEDGVKKISGDFLYNVNSKFIAVTIPKSVTTITANFNRDTKGYAYSDAEHKYKGIIKGYSGSVAEEYAKAKGYIFVAITEDEPVETTTEPETTTTTQPVTEEITTTTTTPEYDDGLVVDDTEITLKENEQYTITANRSDLSFKSSNTDVAIVSKSGVITAWGVGNAVISIMDSDGNFAQIKVTVVSDTGDTTIDETEVTLKENEQYTINASGSGLSYKSDDTSVAIVSKSGVITAWGEGTAVVSVIDGEDVIAVINVTVTSANSEESVYKAGDANGDNNVTISDAVAILQSISNADKYPLSEQVDGVAGVTGKDAAVIQLFDARVITELPIK